jgi:hypothetical protein
MSSLLDNFRYHLQTPGRGYYPEGCKCLFLPGEKWEHLCHYVSNTKANKRAVKKAFGRSIYIDLPLFNVVPGSRESNIGYRHGYSRTPCTMPSAVVYAAQEAIRESIPDVTHEYILDFLRREPGSVSVVDAIAYRTAFYQDVICGIHPHKVFL